MSVTRDIIQGFIDGYISTGGDPSALPQVVSQYLAVQPDYPSDPSTVSKIVSDVPSYRVTAQNILAPTPVPTVPVVLK